MQFLLDNLTATIIASTLVLMLITVNSRTQQVAVETTSFHAMMKQGENFIQILRRDMQGVIQPRSPYGVAAGDSLVSFSFRGVIGTNTSADSIRYTPTLVDTVYTDLDDGSTLTLPVYRLTRYVNGVPAGGSLDMFTQWQITCRDQGDNPVTVANLETCSNIEITFEAIPRLGNSTRTVAQMHWSSVFHPPLIQPE